MVGDRFGLLLFYRLNDKIGANLFFLRESSQEVLDIVPISEKS